MIPLRDSDIAVAIYVFGVVTTLSPLLRPYARPAILIASVPLPTPTAYFVPI
jgi:hypothetical protein